MCENLLDDRRLLDTDELGIENEWGVVPGSPHDLEIVMRNWEGNFFDHYQRVFGKE